MLIRRMLWCSVAHKLELVRFVDSVKPAVTSCRLEDDWQQTDTGNEFTSGQHVEIFGWSAIAFGGNSGYNKAPANVTSYSNLTLTPQPLQEWFSWTRKDHATDSNVCLPPSLSRHISYTHIKELSDYPDQCFYSFRCFHISYVECKARVWNEHMKSNNYLDHEIENYRDLSQPVW
jgi:hypothetical protein